MVLMNCHFGSEHILGQSMKGLILMELSYSPFSKAASQDQELLCDAGMKLGLGCRYLSED